MAATKTTITTNTVIQLTALYFTGLIALIGMVTFCLCGIWKIYLDVPLLLVLSNVTIGAASSFTTLLTGRTISQLNQQDTQVQPQSQPQNDNNIRPTTPL
jgi:hypothetical protein